jgi:SAM-dependent methyltransferase
VLKVGGSVPIDAVRGLGVAHWTACDREPVVANANDYTTLTADARALPLGGESVDAAYSVCAFEHFADLGAVLAEVHRVPRPAPGSLPNSRRSGPPPPGTTCG